MAYALENPIQCTHKVRKIDSDRNPSHTVHEPRKVMLALRPSLDSITNVCLRRSTTEQEEQQQQPHRIRRIQSSILSLVAITFASHFTHHFTYALQQINKINALNSFQINLILTR